MLSTATSWLSQPQFKHGHVCHVNNNRFILNVHKESVELHSYIFFLPVVLSLLSRPRLFWRPASPRPLAATRRRAPAGCGTGGRDAGCCRSCRRMGCSQRPSAARRVVRTGKRQDRWGMYHDMNDFNLFYDDTVFILFEISPTKRDTLRSLQNGHFVTGPNSSYIISWEMHIHQA